MEKELQEVDALPDNKESTGTPSALAESPVTSPGAPLAEQPAAESPTTPGSEEPKKSSRQSNPSRSSKRGILLIVLAVLLVVSAAVISYLLFFRQDPTPPAATTTEQQTTTPPVATKSQDDTVKELIAHISSTFPATTPVTDSNAVMQPHRLMPAPYNFYAAGTKTPAYEVSSAAIADAVKASELMKHINSYLTDTQKATADKIMGTADGLLLVSEKTGSNYYRYTADAFTCGVTQEPVNTMSAANSYLGVRIAVSCATAETYAKNAEIQKPFYAAYFATSDTKKATAEGPMLGLPSTPKPSKTSGYFTATAAIGSEAPVGGAAGLFYKTPDGTWHFFLGAQNIVGCDKYSTPDLKKAYLGEPCSNNGVDSTVTL